MSDQFMAYRRGDGRVGIRNRVIVMPSVGCSERAARLITSRVAGTAFVGYKGGCSQTEVDLGLAIDILAKYGAHPNSVGALVVSLGCEGLDSAALVERIAAFGTPVELLVIQKLGGMRRTIERGVELAERMLRSAQSLKREPCPVCDLTIGLECGGSDATSGMAANPAMGHFSDLIAAQKGRVILAETSELLGAEHILASRASSPDIARRFLETISECEAALKATGEDFMGKQPTPGNVLGGITTVEEKALGDALKGGTTPIVDVLKYGQAPTKAGLSFMDTPGNDPASVTALVAAGSQIVAFTTGRGNPMGNSVAPVIKITGNAQTWARMGEDMDVDASPIISGEQTVEQVGRRIYDLCMRIAEGQMTAAELMGHEEFDIIRTGPTY